MAKVRIIVAIVLVLVLVGCSDYVPEEDIGYLIVSMETARGYHQDIVDNPELYNNWHKAGIDHAEWVRIYDGVIRELKR